MSKKKQPKILLWRMKEMCENFNEIQLAAIYIKVESGFETFKPKNKYKDGQELFNPKAFFNAVKKHSEHSTKQVKIKIKVLKSNTKMFEKTLKSMGKMISKAGKGYNKFDLSFDDVLFSHKEFEDKVGKKLLKKNKKTSNKTSK